MEAKGLEPSNLLTASQQLYHPAGSAQYASVQVNQQFRRSHRPPSYVQSG